MLADRYSVEREVGRGGVARVFLARDPEGVDVAVKVLRPELAVSIMADRFLREIHLVSTLDHPRIARVIAWGRREWLLYYVMPFFDGPTLAGLLARSGRLNPAAARQLGAELLDALEHAHAHGIVHRDVKPENIVMSTSGAILLDFGIARAIAAAGTDPLTQSGMAVGTCAYMSPEQISAEFIDHRSDVYAVGCVLYEAISGQAPFASPNPNVVLQMHLTQPAPACPGAPPALAAVIARALEKTPAARWPDAASMREALLRA